MRCTASRPTVHLICPFHNVSPFLMTRPFSVFLCCISDLYFKHSTYVSFFNPASHVNVNADVVTVLRIRIVHASRHESLQSSSLTFVSNTICLYKMWCRLENDRKCDHKINNKIMHRESSKNYAMPVEIVKYIIIIWWPNFANKWIRAYGIKL